MSMFCLILTEDCVRKENTTKTGTNGWKPLTVLVTNLDITISIGVSYKTSVVKHQQA